MVSKKLLNKTNEIENFLLLQLQFATYAIINVFVPDLSLRLAVNTSWKMPCNLTYRKLTQFLRYLAT